MGPRKTYHHAGRFATICVPTRSTTARIGGVPDVEKLELLICVMEGWIGLLPRKHGIAEILTLVQHVRNRKAFSVTRQL